MSDVKSPDYFAERSKQKLASCYAMTPTLGHTVNHVFAYGRWFSGALTIAAGARS